MKNQVTKRVVAVLLTIAMVVSCFAMLSTVFAAGTTYTVIAGSDFQNPSGDSAGQSTVNSILSQMKQDYAAADGFLFCGDYNYSSTTSTSLSNSGLAALKSTVKSNYSSLTDDKMAFVQGNHDPAGTTGLASSGAHDQTGYGVFVINEDDYMWRNDTESTVRATANNLQTYLNAKLAEGYTAPIFVLSHLPLHYTMRTKNDGDGQYANYIFDVLNAAGANGLNIVFLCGHDHSNGWDDYLGGSAVYLAKGDSINIAQASKTNFRTETLNFTYMNAGYTGYYENHNGADDALTMTVFRFDDNEMTIARYDANGVHNLKSAGKTNSYKNETGYSPNTDIYNSPVTISVGAAEPLPDEQTFTDPSGITVTTRYGTGVTVSTLPNTVAYDNIDDYVLYDIAVTDFVQGEEAVVTIPVPDSFAGSRLRVYHVNDNGELVNMNAVISGGAATFTTDHFSKYMLAKLNADNESLDWVTIPGESTYTYTLDTDGIDGGEKYLIVAPSNAYALVGTSRQSVTINNNTITTDTNAYEWAVDSVDTYNRTTVTCSGGSYTLQNPTSYYYQVANNDYRQITSATCTRSGNGSNRRYTWTINYQGGTAKPTTQSVTLYTKSYTYTIMQGGKYLRTNNSQALVTDGTSSLWTITNGTTSGQYRLTNNGNNLRYYYTSFSTSTGDNYVRMFRLTNTVITPGGFAALAGPTEYTVAVGETPTLMNEVLFKASEDAEPVQVDYDFGSVNTSTAGDKTIPVSYEGQNLGTITVHVKAITVTGISVAPMIGEVYEKSKPTAQTGSTLTVTYSDGSTKTIPMTCDMLSGSFNIGTVGEYTNLTVTYQGKSVSGYTLTVKEKEYNDYPEYPEGGSVRVDKQGYTSEHDYFGTGVSRIDLSTTGVPINEGEDVILVLDTSSSMTTAVSGSTRIQVLRDSVNNFITYLKQPNEDRSDPDIDLAIIDFNKYSYIDPTNDHLGATATTRGGTGNEAGVLLPFTGIMETNFNVNSIVTSSGTNYDSAFQKTYDMVAAKKAENEANGDNRVITVIFMSDGAPFQYNYFGAQSSDVNWNYWLQGTVDKNASYWTRSPSSHKEQFYNEEGKHWMAEAIKGDPDKTYKVIRENAGAANNYITQVPGLGATMFSVGFCLEDDTQITTDSMHAVIDKIATDENHVYYANTAADLQDAFKEFGYSVKKAGTDAYYVDQMGDDFKLQTASYVVRGSDSAHIPLNPAPTIKVKSYELYKAADVNGTTVTTSMVGTRKSDTPKSILETVTFNADGTQAYSDKIGNSVNIMTDGVINAKSFWYNNNDTVKEITLDDGSTYELPANSFMWKIGDITEDEIVLSYYVYLRGSMEGTRDEGSYPTNNYADLHYTNYLDRNAVQQTVSPVLPWGGANVSYAFYLVDENGVPVVNQTSGQTGSFTNSVKMTSPVVYSKVSLNSGEAVSAELVAQGLIPEGYSLYDDSAAYQVTINSNATGSWAITKGSVSADTTYVTGYGGNPTTQLTMSDTNVDYTHTTVWFAIKYEIKAVPDVVVIDYGLSVDINVLANDMFGANGTLVAVGSACPGGNYTNTLADGFAATYTGSHGTAELNGTKVRYTPADMKMDSVETFAYAVHYTGNGVDRYFYSTVKVVPAANMYFEESFVGFDGAWTDAGSMDNALQSEDRPGTYTLGAYDANNVYGYDPAYTGYTTYSYGAAKKVTVSTDYYNNNGAWPNATFTFTGSRFDLISMTSNTTGFIRVEVYKGNEASDTPVAKWAVDTYYGFNCVQDAENPWLKLIYTYHAEDGKWHSVGEPVAAKGTDGVKPTNPNDGDSFVMYRPNYTWTTTTDSNPLYQVPVIRSKDLGYGTYTVVVTPCYASLFDHPSAGSYDFYLDSVRVYGPAQGLDAEYYTQDHEGWPQYIGIRENLLDQESFAVDGSEQVGAVFIDGFGTDGSISQYDTYGPNNEVYLQRNQAVAFILSGVDTEKVDSVQIGMKSVNGSVSSAEIAGLNSNGALTKITKIGTASELFYPLGNTVVWNNGQSNVLIVRNTAESILSLTNVKVTFTSDPNAQKSKMKISCLTAEAAAKYVQDAVMKEMTECEHAYSISVAKQPTAEAEGEAKITCSKCGFEDGKTLPVLNQTDYVYAVTKAATCTESGSETYSIAFDEFGTVVVEVETPALGHEDVDGTCARCGAVLGAQIFDDVSPDAWYYNEVSHAAQKGLLLGVDKKTFDPEGKLTRAMAVTILWRLAGMEKAGTNIFTDVKDGEWYTEAISWAAEKGIVNGKGNNQFMPNDILTREEFATILYRYSKAFGMDVEAEADLSQFPDEKAVSSWAEDAFGWAVANKLILGSSKDGKAYLDPQGVSTRAQAAAILMRYCDLTAE